MYVTIKTGKSQKIFEVIPRPLPHILVETDKKMHGWWKGKRECTGERMLINPYAGCNVKCPFCYANALWGYHQVYNNQGVLMVCKDFDKEIARQLDSIDAASCGYLSPVTDPFQSINKYYGLSEKIIKEFISRNIPIEFITKQVIPQEVIEDIRSQEHSFGQVTILTINETKRKVLAPGGASTEQLLDNIRRLHGAGIFAVCRIDPILPYITDDRRELEDLVYAAREAGADHIITSVMDLSFKTKQRIFDYLEKRNPGIARLYEQLYTEILDGSFHADIGYRKGLFSFMKDICAEVGITLALCMEYEKIGDNVVGLNREFMTSYNCEGMDVPLYKRSGDRFYPVKDCRGNCLDCSGDACSINKEKKGKDLTLSDYRKWQFRELTDCRQITLFDR